MNLRRLKAEKMAYAIEECFGSDSHTYFVFGFVKKSEFKKALTEHFDVEKVDESKIRHTYLLIGEMTPEERDEFEIDADDVALCFRFDDFYQSNRKAKRVTVFEED